MSSLTDIAAMQNSVTESMGKAKKDHIIKDAWDLEMMLSGPFQAAGIAGQGAYGYEDIPDSMAAFRNGMLDDSKRHLVQHPLNDDLRRRLYMAGFECSAWDKDTGTTEITHDPYAPGLEQWNSGDKAGFLLAMDQYMLERKRNYSVEHTESFGFEEDLARVHRTFMDATAKVPAEYASKDVSRDNRDAAIRAAGETMDTIWRYKGSCDAVKGDDPRNPYNIQINMTRQEWGIIGRMSQQMENTVGGGIGFVQAEGMNKFFDMQQIPDEDRWAFLMKCDSIVDTQVKDYNACCPGFVPSVDTLVSNVTKQTTRDGLTRIPFIGAAIEADLCIKEGDKDGAMRAHDQFLTSLAESRATFEISESGRSVKSFSLNLTDAEKELVGKLHQEARNAFKDEGVFNEEYVTSERFGKDKPYSTDLYCQISGALLDAKNEFDKEHPATEPKGPAAGRFTVSEPAQEKPARGFAKLMGLLRRNDREDRQTDDYGLDGVDDV